MTKQTKFIKIKEALFNFLMNRYKNLAINIFQYEGFPEGYDLNGIRLEKYLFDNGHVLFFKDAQLGFLTLPSANIGINHYNEPVKYTVTAPTLGRTIDLSNDNAVLMKNNFTRTSTFDMISYWVEKLVLIEMASNTNLYWTRVPLIIEVDDDKNLLSYKKFLEDIEEGKPVVLAKKGLNPQPSDKISINIKNLFIGKELSDEFNTVEGRILTILGVDNNAVDKKERVNTIEANSNGEIIEGSLLSSFEVRKQAIEKINEMFGLNITVKLNPALAPKEPEQANPKEEDDEDDDSIE